MQCGRDKVRLTTPHASHFHPRRLANELVHAAGVVDPAELSGWSGYTRLKGAHGFRYGASRRRYRRVALPECLDNDSHWFDQITMRRAQVLRELAEGRTQRQVAATLGLTVSGVRSHVDDIMRATRFNNSRDVARWWRAERACWVRHMAHAAGCQSEQ